MDGFLLYVIMLKVVFYHKTLKYINTFPSEHLVNSIFSRLEERLLCTPESQIHKYMSCDPNKLDH